MKGYDACVFPREGDPVLITIEASEADAAHSAWTGDVRFIKGYAPDDPRPVPARTLDALKRRLWAGAGACQGSLCVAELTALLASELGVDPAEVRKNAAGSELLVG